MHIKNILITGGSGLVGKRLTLLLQQHGYTVGWLSRKKTNYADVKMYAWDIKKGFIDAEAITWAHAIIHLAGENISSKRWTEKRKQEIVESRVKSAALIKKYLDTVDNHISIIISASAIGYYGYQASEILTEENGAGEGFLSACCVEWEKAIKAFESEKRTVFIFRFGIVLSTEGGALTELMKTIPFGIAPVLGDGKQIYSWIHIDDVCGMLLFALQENIESGIYNSVAPHPVSQKELMKTIIKLSGKRAILFPVPVFILRIMLGEMANTVLISQHISCNKIQKTGYVFQYVHVENALKNIFNK